MARKFLTAIDLSKLELQNARIQNLATDPASPVSGQIYYNTSSNELKVYNGSSWTQTGLSFSAGTGLTLTGTAFSVNYGTIAGTAAQGNDSRLTNSRTPTGAAAGDLTGTYPNPTLAAAGTAGTYTKVTTDAKGRVTSGTTLSATDIPTLTSTKISDFDTQVRASRLDQMASPSADVSFNSRKITNLAEPSATSDAATKNYVLTRSLSDFNGPDSEVSFSDQLLTNVGYPVSDTDAATKGYVDAFALGLDVKFSVRAATTTNITLSGTQTVDGVALVVEDRVLVKNQTTASANGLYNVQSTAWIRTEDADSNAEFNAGLFTFVEEGTTNSDSGWVLTTNNPITLGTTALAFTQFSGAGAIVAGDGLGATGSTFSVNVDSSTIEINTDTLRVKDAGITNAKLATGIDAAKITTGTLPVAQVPNLDTAKLTAGTLGVARGGTGLASLTTGSYLRASGATSVEQRTADQLRGDIGAIRKYATTLSTSATSYTVTHSLGTQDVTVGVFLITGGNYEQIECDVTLTGTSALTLAFAVAPTANTIRVVVTG